MDDAAYQLVRRAILDVLHLDIQHYKTTQMRRRLGSFIIRYANGEIDRFCRLLASDRVLVEQLRNFLTINVSEFFRDPEQFTYLRQHVLPRLLAESRPLRVLSAGCAAGEEPYSIAIQLAEMGMLDRTDLLATDLDHETLARAKAGGPYHDKAMRNVSARQRLRFFTTSPDGPRLRGEIARAVTFRRHDLLSHGIYGTFDLIACRNVLIYFTTDVKQRIIRRLCESLRPNGVLFLGGTESLTSSEQPHLRKLHGHFYTRTLPVTADAIGQAG